MNWARKPALPFIFLGVGMFAIDRLELSPPWESHSGGSEPASGAECCSLHAD